MTANAEAERRNLATRDDELKLDRTFVADLGQVKGAESIVAAVVALGAARGLGIVAEGVEEESQLDVLRQLHCDFAQGYLFGAAVWPDRLRASLESGLLSPERTS